MYTSISLPSSLHVGEDPVQMDLWSPSVHSEPRYTLSVIDLHKRKGKNGPFAIFIVPQGRYVQLYVVTVAHINFIKATSTV